MTKKNTPNKNIIDKNISSRLNQSKSQETDQTSSKRKLDHLNLTEASQQSKSSNDTRFNYEPILAQDFRMKSLEVEFFGSTLSAPLWISSMTGGADEAGPINQRLAKVVKNYQLGMGTGSVRALIAPFLESKLDLSELSKLDSHDLFQSYPFTKDFNLRPLVGAQPLLGNIGICQLEEMAKTSSFEILAKMEEVLDFDGWFIHVNLLQEFFQPEGDRLAAKPIDLIRSFCDWSEQNKARNTSKKRWVMVKEVGQGFGPDSLKALCQLSIDGLEFGAFGGTNFSLLEKLRQDNRSKMSYHEGLCNVGHDCPDMISELAAVLSQSADNRCRHFIISGGVKTYLDGYYLTELFKDHLHREGLESKNYKIIYAQAGQMLKHAYNSQQDELTDYVDAQIEGLKLSSSYLSLRKST